MYASSQYATTIVAITRPSRARNESRACRSSAESTRRSSELRSAAAAGAAAAASARARASVALRVGVCRRRRLVPPLQLLRGLVRLERGPVRLAAHLEVLERLRRRGSARATRAAAPPLRAGSPGPARTALGTGTCARTRSSTRVYVQMPPSSRNAVSTTASSFSVRVVWMSSTSGRDRHFGSSSHLRPGPELDEQLAVERLGDAEERVDPRRAAAALEARDRRLRRAAELRELLLRQAARRALLDHLLRDPREEPALLGLARDALAQVGEPAVQCGLVPAFHSVGEIIAPTL